MRLLGSKNQCEAEEDHVLEEEAGQISDQCSNIGIKNNESTNSETPEDKKNKHKDKENTDKRTDRTQKENKDFFKVRYLDMINIIIHRIIAHLNYLYVFTAVIT